MATRRKVEDEEDSVPQRDIARRRHDARPAGDARWRHQSQPDADQRGKAIAQQQQQLVTDGSSRPMAMHRPGWRVLADANRRALDDEVKSKAYQEVEQRDANAWKGANRTNQRDSGGRPMHGARCAIS